MLEVKHKTGKFCIDTNHIVSIHLDSEVIGLKEKVYINGLDHITDYSAQEKDTEYSVTIITKESIEYYIYKTNNQDDATEVYISAQDFINCKHPDEYHIIECPEYDLGLLADD